MPIYEYKCHECGKVFEKLQSYSASLETTCEDCNSKVEKLISNSAFQLKGAGWYVNEYSKSGSSSKNSTPSCGSDKCKVG